MLPPPVVPVNSSPFPLEDNFLSSSLVVPDVEDDVDEIDINALPVSDGDLPHTPYDLTESFVAQKMSSLSMKEREEVYYDIHGVHDVIDEDAESDFLPRKLNDMENELRKLNYQDKQAYELAQCLNPGYVHNTNFRLRFLRAERFDPKLAAARYVRHYQTKLELFGPEKLGRHITQDDLGAEALEKLYCGKNQVLPKRDAAGRLVWLWITAPKKVFSTKEVLMRRIFYNNMMVSEDLETQRKGSVGIIYTLNQQQRVKGAIGREVIRSVAAMAKSLPMPIAGIHFCYNKYAWLPVLSVAQLSSHLFLQLRFKAHLGSHSECIFNLQTYGIPADTIPINENGKVNASNHKRFLEKRRALERQSPREVLTGNFSTVSVPGRSDVLLGRGKGYFNHVGNVRYRALIEDLKATYDKANRDERNQLAKEVVGIVHESGGRFLRDDDGTWSRIDDEAARQKIGHSFRALRSSTPRQPQQNTAKSTNRAERGDAAPISKRMCRD